MVGEGDTTGGGGGGFEGWGRSLCGECGECLGQVEGMISDEE